jgi:hypothetical protein
LTARGLGLATRIGKDLIQAMDYVDLFGQMGEDDNIGKRIHVGVEYRPMAIIACGRPEPGVHTWVSARDENIR